MTTWKTDFAILLPKYGRPWESFASAAKNNKGKGNLRDYHFRPHLEAFRRWGASTRTLEGILAGTRPTDPVVFAIVSIALAGVTLLASWLPARRAARVDPIEVLRHE
jgi:hypothetical protein